jgi:hypothetical protein
MESEVFAVAMLWVRSAEDSARRAENGVLCAKDEFFCYFLSSALSKRVDYGTKLLHILSIILGCSNYPF